MIITNDITVLLTILFAALATYILRIGGLLLAERLPSKGRFKLFMDALPGTLLLSLIAPGVAAAGILGGAAALATAVCTHKTGNSRPNPFLGQIKSSESIPVIKIKKHSVTYRPRTVPCWYRIHP